MLFSNKLVEDIPDKDNIRDTKILLYCLLTGIKPESIKKKDLTIDNFLVCFLKELYNGIEIYILDKF